MDSKTFGKTGGKRDSCKGNRAHLVRLCLYRLDTSLNDSR